MKWTDVHDIAIALEEQYPNVVIMTVRYTDLWQWVQQLEGFTDNPDRCSERILQVIQMAWIDERD
jgi:FeS assembly protein IscX